MLFDSRLYGIVLSLSEEGILLVMRVLLLNDTEEHYHWGCYGTSHAIKMKLRELGADEISSISVDEIRTMKAVPKRRDDFGDSATFHARNRRLAEAMDNCDAVVINGEGTIHGLRNAPRALLFSAYAAKKYCGKLVSIINHACFPKYFRPDVLDYYRAGYSACDYVAARDKSSTATINDLLGVKCVQAFDSLPLSIREIVDKLSVPTDLPARYLCLAGAANYSVLQSPVIARLLQEKYPDHAAFFLAGSARGGKLFEDIRAFRSLRRYLPGLQWLQATTFRDWLSYIKHAELLLSGRFHYTIAAACLATPVITFQSNTDKVAQLFAELGWPPAVPRVAEFWENIGKPKKPTTTLEEFEAALRNAITQLHDTPAYPRLEECCQRAELNYNGVMLPRR